MDQAKSIAAPIIPRRSLKPPRASKTLRRKKPHSNRGATSSEPRVECARSMFVILGSRTLLREMPNEGSPCGPCTAMATAERLRSCSIRSMAPRHQSDPTETPSERICTMGAQAAITPALINSTALHFPSTWTKRTSSRKSNGSE